jgi:hypothetical protein
MNKNKAPATASPPQPGGPGPLSGPGDNLDMIAQPMFPILTDPMTDMLAPGDLKQESEDLSIPDEIKALFDMHGLSKKGFRSMLKQLPEGVEDTSQGVYVKSWSRSFPSTDWIALNYGPGTYELCFQFKGYVEGKMANQTERIIINISDKLADEHEEFIFRKKLKRSEERRKQISNAKLHKQLDFDVGDDKKENNEGIPVQMMQMVQQFSSIATSLGFNRGGGTDWGKILASALPLLPAVMGYL